MLFSERLEILLKERNVTWKEVYETCHIGKNQKKYWADKGITPDLETLLKLAKYFAVPLDYLRGIDDLKQQSLDLLDDQVITLNAKEVEIILKYRNLDAEGKTIVESVVIQETRRMAAKAEETNVE